jgi:hypothetical protein
MFEDKVYEFKRQLISDVLQRNRWNKCRAARVLGMHRNTLSRYVTILRIQFPHNIRAANALFADAQRRAMTHQADASTVPQHIR